MGRNALLLLLLAAQHVVNAQYDPLINFCRRVDTQTTVINGKLYVDGGRELFVTYDNNGTQISNRTLGNNQYLISVDVSTSWDWKASNFPQTAIQKGQDVTGALPVPDMSRGALYPDPSNPHKFWLFGGSTALDNTTFVGYQNPQAGAYSLWSYDSQNNTWTAYDMSKYGIQKPASGLTTYVPKKGLAFWFNGMQDNGSSTELSVLGSTSRFLDGMIVLDLNNQTAKNISTAAVSNQARVRGHMVHIPLPDSDGILVLIGGGEKPSSDLTHEWKGTLVSLEQVDIFDVGSLKNASTPNGVWYRQLTSGAIPSPRIDACIVVASAPDNSSHNIYMYGGRNGENTYYDETWVLTLPSFQWIQVHQGTSPRYSHTCHVVGNRQMITTGGSDTSKLATGCDWHTKGVGVLDMTTIKWGSAFNANALPYRVPSNVVQIIGGSPDGNATFGVPTSGFSNSGLKDLFFPPSNPSTTIPAAAPSTPSEQAPEDLHPKKKASAGAVAGGVIGGLLGLAAIAAFVILFLRRARQRRLHAYPNVAQLDGDDLPPKFLDSSPVFEKSGVAVRNLEIPEKSDSASDFGSHKSHVSEEPVEMPAGDVVAWQNKTDGVKLDDKKVGSLERKPVPSQNGST